MGEFPSKENQFKPGQSGNPAGKPKGTKNYSTRLRERLETILKLDGVFTDEQIEQTLGDHINDQFIKNCLEGKQSSIDSLYDRLEGKPKSGDAPDPDANVGGVLAVPNAQGLTSEEWEKQYAEHNAKIAEKVNEKSKERVVRV